MQSMLAIAGIATMIMTAPGLSPAMAQSPGCAINGAILDCSAGGTVSDREALVAAFAAPQTREALSRPHFDNSQFSDGSAREAFRRSFERYWSMANALDGEKRSALKRRQISRGQYDAWAMIWNEALETYRSAYRYYKTQLWITGGEPVSQ